MQVICPIGTYCYYSDVMFDGDSLWIVIVQHIMIVYLYKYEIYFCLQQYFIVLVFLSPLFLADFYRLNFLLWYISDAVVFSTFNKSSMFLVIICLCCQCFLDLLLIYLFLCFYFSCFILWHWYHLILLVDSSFSYLILNNFFLLL